VSTRWPLEIVDGDLLLTPLRLRDRANWDSVREINREWLEPWEATRPSADLDATLPSFSQMVRRFRREGRAGRSLTLAIWFHDGKGWNFVGQVTLGGIIYGAFRGAHIGYWIDQRFANRGITTRAVQLISEYGFQSLQLHRIEINLRPENEASRRVAEKAGFIFEGVRNRYLHISGEWRDHLCFVKENPAIL